MSELGGLPVLEHLNLSGCLSVTEAGLHQLVSACPALNDEHFYYCDNINGREPHRTFQAVINLAGKFVKVRLEE